MNPDASDYEKYFKDIYFRIFVDAVAEFIKARQRQDPPVPMEQIDEEMKRAIVMGNIKVVERGM